MAIRGSSITRNSTIFPGYLCIFFLKRSKRRSLLFRISFFLIPKIRTLNESLKRSNFRIFARNGRSSNRDEERNGGKFERKAIALAEKKKRGKKIRITKMKLEKKKNVRNRMYRRTVLRVCLVSDAF